MTIVFFPLVFFFPNPVADEDDRVERICSPWNEQNIARTWATKTRSKKKTSEKNELLRRNSFVRARVTLFFSVFSIASFKWGKSLVFLQTSLVVSWIDEMNKSLERLVQIVRLKTTSLKIKLIHSIIKTNTELNKISIQWYSRLLFTYVAFECVFLNY